MTSIPTKPRYSFPHNASIIWMALYGVLLGLSAPGYHLGWLAWLALAPALLWAYHCVDLKKRLTGGFVFGFCFQALYCLWFFDLHPLTWLGFDTLGSRLVTLAGWSLIGIEGGVLTAFFFGLCDLETIRKVFKVRWLQGTSSAGKERTEVRDAAEQHRNAVDGQIGNFLDSLLRNPVPIRLICLPIIWLALFTLLNTTPLALPWGLLEYTQAGFWPIRWLAGHIGGIGITLTLLLHNVALAEYLRRHSKNALKPAIISLIIPLGLAFAPDLQQSPEAYPLPVAIVQANLPIELVRSGALNAADAESAYLQPIRNTPLPSGTLVLLPEEGAVPGLVRLQAPESNPSFLELEKLAQRKKIYIAVGISTLSGAKHLFNTIALISPVASQPVQFYHKRRLVPFGEYTPYHLGEALTNLLNQFQVDYSAPYAAGQQEAPLTAGSAKLGGLVCFELIDAIYARQYQQQNATLLINLSNLGWFHQNPLLEAQFLAIGQIRAAETRTPLAIASNTGTSAILSGSGKILKQIHPSKWVKNGQQERKSQIIFYN